MDRASNEESGASKKAILASKNARNGRRGRGLLEEREESYLPS